MVMNKNLVGIILIIVAVVLVGLYAWPKLKPYFVTPAPEPGAGEMTTVPL